MSRRKKFIEDNDQKVNVSTIFIIPMLGFNNRLLPDEFLSAYLQNDNKNCNKIILTFENSNSDVLKEAIAVLQENENLFSIEYEDDNKEIVATFDIPKSFQSDFSLIMKGKYSKIGKEYKEILLDYHGRKTGNGKCIYMIDALFPDYQTKTYRAEKLGVSISDLPNGEVMSIPSDENELYVKAENLNDKKEGDFYGVE